PVLSPSRRRTATRITICPLGAHADDRRFPPHQSKSIMAYTARRSPGLGPRSGSSRVCEGLPQTSSCALRPHNEIDVTVENLQQGDELIDGLAVVCLIHESIELGRGSRESADDLTLR